MKAHRERLGLSAENYGKLLGASALSVYNWEQGKARPRKRSVDACMVIRRIGKREAAKRLASLKAAEPKSESKQAPSREVVAEHRPFGHCVAFPAHSTFAGVTSQPPGVAIHRGGGHGASSSRCHVESRVDGHRTPHKSRPPFSSS